MIAESLFCIAIAVYFEARGEPSNGQVAVAHSVRNRVADRHYPDNACDVVKQGYYWNEHPIRDRCQFSFWCDGKSDNPRNEQAWYNALYIAELSGYTADITEGAMWYHSDTVSPNWATTEYVQIGSHKFYKEVK